jgi:sugar phosphate isomerase/epimerase
MELVELIDRVDRSNVGICLDIANALRLGDEPSRTNGEAASLVRMIHLRDIEPLENLADPIAGPATVPLGEGVAPLRETLARLAEPLAGGTPVLVEVGQVGPTYDEFELIISGLDWLRAYRNRWLGERAS